MNNEIEKFIEELKNRDITKEVLEKLTEYANQGNNLAKSTFGSLYEKSEIIKKDINKAFEYYKKYANYKCNAEAQYLIAIYFSENAEHQKYLYWLRKSAENGCTEA